MGGRSLRLFPIALVLLRLTSAAAAAAELDKSAVEFTPRPRSSGYATAPRTRRR